MNIPKTAIRRHLKRLHGLIKNYTEAIPYVESGNRSTVKLNYRAYLQDPNFLRLVTEYRATGNFTGHLVELSLDDYEVVNQIRESVMLLAQMQRERRDDFGRRWSESNDAMLQNIISADPRVFNHIGALSYKRFTPVYMSVEQSISEVLRTLALYDHLSTKIPTFDRLFTNLNTPYCTVDGHKLNAWIGCYEEYIVLHQVLREIVTQQEPPTILEIGAGAAQLAHLILKDKDAVKYVIVDLPGMHARAPYYLYKNSKLRKLRICTYKRYLELGRHMDAALRHHDVVFLPPWEKDSIDYHFDLAINVRSLSEMSMAEAKGYLELIRKKCTYFFSINTNTRGLDPRRQVNEHGIVELGEELQMKLISTGTTVADTLLKQTPHCVYAVWHSSS